MASLCASRPLCVRGCRSMVQKPEKKAALVRAAAPTMLDSVSCAAGTVLDQPRCWKLHQTYERRVMSVRSQVQEEPSLDNATVLVAGGGGCGLETVKALAKAGSWVTAYQRHDDYRKEIEELGAMLAVGDVLDTVAIAKAFRGNTFDAVICTVGGKTVDEPEVDKDGPINLINAAKDAGVKRFILVTSIGVGNSAPPSPIPNTYDALKPVLLGKDEAEKYLRESGLNWTILRPGALKNEPATGRAIISEDPTIVGLVTRADVATTIMKMLWDKRTEFKTFSIIDRDQVLPKGRPLQGVRIFPLDPVAPEVNGQGPETPVYRRVPETNSGGYSRGPETPANSGGYRRGPETPAANGGGYRRGPEISANGGGYRRGPETPANSGGNRRASGTPANTGTYRKGPEPGGFRRGPESDGNNRGSETPPV